MRKKKGGVSCANQELNYMERRIVCIANIFWRISNTRRNSYENINNCAASLGYEGVAHEEMASIIRNQFFDNTFNDFDNTGSLQEANRSNLRFYFQKGPQTTDQKMLNSCERNVDFSQVGSKNNGCNQKNSCFDLLNGAIGKLLLFCNKSKRACHPDNFKRQAIERFNSKRIFNLVVQI